MHVTQANDGIKIAYRSFGDGPEVVILVHGWMVSGAVHDDLLEHLDRDGLRVIVPDLRGAGQSDKPEAGYSIQRYADDILAIADAEGIKSFTVVGHSMGGQIAQWLAAHHPDRVNGAVLLCPVPASGAPLPDEAIGLFSSAGGNRDAQRTILGLACKELTPASLERLLDDSARVLPEAMRLSFDVWRKGGFAEALGSIKAPLLVVGTDDPFLPPAALRGEIVAKVRGARFAYLPGPGHYVQVERPRETAALLQAFLAAHRP
ncbi:MAG TPA: alpha/beta fold hydrolase [Polyangium sp.]|nr:alpha/beta fold hydrolase [Polyangium sp.]